MDDRIFNVRMWFFACTDIHRPWVYILIRKTFCGLWSAQNMTPEKFTRESLLWHSQPSMRWPRLNCFTTAFKSECPCCALTTPLSLGVTCNRHFWQNDRGLLRATVVTQGWKGHQIILAQKVNSEEGNSPAAPARTRICNLSITCPVLSQLPGKGINKL